jgi:hypothetical protein
LRPSEVGALHFFSDPLKETSVPSGIPQDFHVSWWSALAASRSAAKSLHFTRELVAGLEHRSVMTRSAFHQIADMAN